MEKTQKIILALIIVTLVFSAVSILLNLFILNNDLDLPTRNEPTTTDGSGELQLVVEKNSVSLEGSYG